MQHVKYVYLYVSLPVATRIDNYIVEVSDIMKTSTITYSSMLFGGKFCNQFHE